MVKRNRLNLTIGILLIIVAGLSAICIINVVRAMVAMLRLYSATSTPIDMSLIGIIFIYAFMIALYLTQVVVYLIFGIKIIKRSQLYNSFESSKTLIIVSLVLVSCSLIFAPLRYLSITYVALIILLILALCYGKKSDEENLQAVNNLNATLHAGENSESKENVVNKNTIDTNKKDNLQNAQTKATEKPIVSQSAQNMMAEKVVALKTLKDNGIISQAEFDKMVGDILSVNVGIDAKPKTIKKTAKTSRPKTSNPKTDSESSSVAKKKTTSKPATKKTTKTTATDTNMAIADDKKSDE